jgi:uncharacterized tellurite resistance protein B-like protein
MFSRLLTAFSGPVPTTPPPQAPLALAALLVRLARADGHYSATEAEGIDHLIAARYGISESDAAKARRGGEALEAEASDTVRFTRALKDAVPHEDRAGLMEALWMVALSDGARDAGEDALIRLAASLLGVNDRDSALARQRVERGT